MLKNNPGALKIKAQKEMECLKTIFSQKVIHDTLHSMPKTFRIRDLNFS